MLYIRLVSVPFAPGRPAHTDISFKYRLLAIMEQKKSSAATQGRREVAQHRPTRTASIKSFK